MRKSLWRTIKDVALTDVTVLVKGLGQEQLDRLEQVLIEADFGPAAFDLIEELEQTVRRGKVKTEDDMRAWLIDRVVTELGEDLGTTGDQTSTGLRVIVMLGVNGVGKTTQAAKLAYREREEGRSVLLAAADTYRAGAIEQLQIWAERLDVPCIVGTQGGDPAAVAYDAIESAMARDLDVAIIDTAGRLHTHSDLMEELRKVIRVVGRKLDGSPYETLLVLDGTVGQNALQQAKIFAETVKLTGLILSKMDGTAKGAAAIPITRELGVPIKFLGVGERLADLEPFDARRFAERIVGV